MHIVGTGGTAVNYLPKLPQEFPRLKREVENVKYNLTLNGYDPESVAAAQASSKPGKRKAAETWNVSRSSHFHPIPPPVC